ncbi:hypothetical protein RclHR1_07760002 [Rhizophagus clarus]|uniref:Uncharacterized protein n=1 Tax=Rhizophagus clarus TaxID=94130 RepID=A0A2Z6SLP6_9GLOM|nr:hypothetical protein RclHR1_07760002 [Rhizophagus clarus]
MQLVELPEGIRYRPRSPLLAFFITTLLGRFVKDCKYHSWEICTANLETQPPVQQQLTTPDIEISQPIKYQSDSMNLDDTIGDTVDPVLSTPNRPNPIIPPATPLSRSQKKSVRKKLKKLQKQQQQPDNNPFIVPSNQSPEHTPSSSKMVTFSNVPPQPVTPSKSSDQ